VQSSRTSTGAGGTGLGLAICREIISLHDGRIWAENISPHGAAICFELPLSAEPETEHTPFVVTTIHREDLPCLLETVS
jgi:signal transduction histidine kinase